MQIKNSSSHYGLLTIFLHWGMAIVIFFLFSIGLYMTGLDYYDPGYKVWPEWHKSFGVVVLLLLILRIIWHRMSKKPLALDVHKKWEVGLAHAIHGLLYLSILVICISGYLISTAEGEGIDLFNWFVIPAIISIGKSADLAGKIHLYAAYFLMSLVGLHVLGAIKHTLFDRDKTLLRMFGK